jgi:hypothetical protein
LCCIGVEGADAQQVLMTMVVLLLLLLMTMVVLALPITTMTIPNADGTKTTSTATTTWTGCRLPLRFLKICAQICLLLAFKFVFILCLYSGFSVLILFVSGQQEPPKLCATFGIAAVPHELATPAGWGGACVENIAVGGREPEHARRAR